MAKANPDDKPIESDKFCPKCGKERALVVQRSEGGMPARCVMYHPGLDTPGIRRFSPSGMAWLVDEGGIRRRDYENDVINRHPGFEP